MNKTILFLIVLFLTSCSKDDLKFGLLDGTWVNKDENTGGLTKLIISEDNTVFHGFGSCSPVDCDWEEVAMTATDSGYEAVYEYSWSTRYLTISALTDSGLEVHSFTDFTEADGRTDYESTFCLEKE